MGTEDRIGRARALYARAVYGGDPDAVDAADRLLDAVESDLLLARGMLLHTRFLAARDADREGARGDTAELAMFERALRLSERLGDTRGEAEALLWVGLYHQVVDGDHARAAPFLARCLELATAAVDTETAAEALRHVGITAHAAGRLDEAREALEASVRLRRELHLEAGVASNLVGLTYVATAQGRRDDAAAHLAEAEVLATSAGAQRIVRQVREARDALDLPA